MKPTRTCSIDGCERTGKIVRGWCRKHYSNWQRNGHPTRGPGSGRRPRQYPQDIVDLICDMYLDGMTVHEIRQVAPRGYRVQTILERYLPERRKAAKRNQKGSANHMWKGDGAGYQAVHLRLGKASTQVCVDCASRAEHWSYTGGASDEKLNRHGVPYSHDPSYYSPRCVPCHHKYDCKGRRPNGQLVARGEVVRYV